MTPTSILFAGGAASDLGEGSCAGTTAPILFRVISSPGLWPYKYAVVPAGPYARAAEEADRQLEPDCDTPLIVEEP